MIDSIATSGGEKTGPVAVIRLEGRGSGLSRLTTGWYLLLSPQMLLDATSPDFSLPDCASSLCPSGRFYTGLQ